MITKTHNKTTRPAIGERINGATRNRKPVLVPAKAGDPMTVADAIRSICRGMNKGQSFTAKTMNEEASRKFPALARKIRTGTHVSLEFLVSKGELRVEGVGRAKIYNVVNIKPPSGVNVTDKEKAWSELRKDIQVPRDQDAGSEK